LLQPIFYGNNISLGYSSFGGWDKFGSERVVTKSEKNILKELDRAIALDLCKEYLGSHLNEFIIKTFYPIELFQKVSNSAGQTHINLNCLQ
jgi:hypothetical protein